MPNFKGSKWVNYDKFQGLQTKYDPTKIEDGANSNGQNTSVNQGDRITNRNLGYAVFPTDSTASVDTTRITSLHNFRKRDGSSVLMRAYDTKMEVYSTAKNSWLTLRSDYTSDKKFGFADHNINTDLHSYTYFGNGVDYTGRWGGGMATVQSVSNATGMIVDKSVSLALNGSNYSVNDVLTITGGGGTGATIKVLSLGTGSILTAAMVNVGAKYALGDVVQLYLPGSTASGATITITGVDGNGSITGWTLKTSGLNYVASTRYIAAGGTGYGADFNVTSAGVTGAISSFSVLSAGSGYAVGTGYATTGGTGTGCTVNVGQVTSNSITISGTSTLKELGFLSDSNLNIIVNGTKYTYLSGVTTTTLTGLSADPVAAGITAGDVILQAIEDQNASPKGNILISYSNRLFISGILDTPQAVYFSKYGDPTYFSGATLVTDSTASSPGIFNLGEGGGGVTGMGFDEQSLYIYKKSIIYKVGLSDSLYTLQPLKPFDGKSQSVGSTSPRAVFTSGNATFFVTPDNQILSLQRIEQLDYPQTSSISDIIKPITDQGNFNEAVGIVFQDKAFFAYKSDNSISANDTVLVFNLTTKQWDSPITGWNVMDFAVYDDGAGERLFFGSATSPNVYKVNTTPTDDVYDVVSSWRSKQFDFGMPTVQKNMSDVYVEGYITPQTNLVINLYIDDNGYTAKFSTTLNGTEQKYLYDSTIINVFGLTPFGTQRFGSNTDTTGKVKFRLYLGKDFKCPEFYNAQIEFTSAGQNQQWEVERFGFKIAEYTQPAKYSLYKAFK